MEKPGAQASWSIVSLALVRLRRLREEFGDRLQVGNRNFVLVSEEEMGRAILIYLELIRNLAEEAGASPLAAALKIKDRLKGKTVALVLSGSSISLERLRWLLNNQ